jgi:phage baseplate assembly protein V
MMWIWQRVLHMIRSGRITVVDDTGPVQRVQVDQGALGPDDARSIVDKVPFLGIFGFSSSPPIQSDVVVLRLGGTRSLTVAIGTNHQPSRLKGLGPGDSAQYDVRGAYIRLTAAGIIIDGAGLPMTIRNVGTMTLEGELHVTGDVVARSAGTAVSLNGLHDAYDAHKHTGVTAGAALSGTTDHPA